MKRNLGLIVAITLVVFGCLLVAKTAHAQEAPSEVTIEVAPEEATTGDSEATAEEATNDAYSFVAQPGDSYTKIARKAVQIFGFDNTVELSGAQIVYIETNLTLAADSPELEVGEAVTISKTLISEWVEKAKALSEAKKSAWQVYAERVDFNTDNVGESRQ